MDYYYPKTTTSRSRYIHYSHHQNSNERPNSTNNLQQAPLQIRPFFNWTRITKNHSSSSSSSSSKEFNNQQTLSSLSQKQQEKEEEEKSNNNKPTGLFGKLKQLTKLYGSAALVVYGLLGAVDFGLTFLTIYLVGEEHVRRAEDWLLDQLNWKRVLNTNPNPNTFNQPIQSTYSNNNNNNNTIENNHNNMLWTTAVVAYTIHKTILLPVRLGLTAWITPPIVRALRKRGWKLGRNLE